MTRYPVTRDFLAARPAGPVAGSPGYDLGADRRAADVPPPRVAGDDVETVLEVDAGGVPARLYLPAAATSAVVAVHGGGWVKGSVAAADPVWRLLAATSGLAVLSVEYRLAPEHPYPAALEDVEHATAWLRSHGGGHGLNTHALGIVGDSAGGNLAAGAVLRDRQAYAAQVLVYPATDLTCAAPSHAEEREGLLTEAMQYYWQAYAGNYWQAYAGNHGQAYAEAQPPHSAPPAAGAIPPDLSPAFAPDLTGLPPAYVLTSEHDCLRDEGEQYAARLADAGVPVVGVRLLGMPHGCWNNPAAFPQAAAAVEAAGVWLRRVLQAA